jgi:hypothetical protein
VTSVSWGNLQIDPLLTSLCRSKVEFVVLGSVARLPRGDLQRQPRDLDLAPESYGNLERLAGCLNDLQVCGDLAPDRRMPVVVALFHGGNAWAFRCAYGRIEVCLPVGSADTFAYLRPGATTVPVNGREVRVASIADLDRQDAARVRPETRDAAG